MRVSCSKNWKPSGEISSSTSDCPSDSCTAPAEFPVGLCKMAKQRTKRAREGGWASIKSSGLPQFVRGSSPATQFQRKKETCMRLCEFVWARGRLSMRPVAFFFSLSLSLSEKFKSRLRFNFNLTLFLKRAIKFFNKDR